MSADFNYKQAPPTIPVGGAFLYPYLQAVDITKHAVSGATYSAGSIYHPTQWNGMQICLVKVSVLGNQVPFHRTHSFLQIQKHDRTDAEHKPDVLPHGKLFFIHGNRHDARDNDPARRNERKHQRHRHQSL